jgi:hypothetical protein
VNSKPRSPTPYSRNPGGGYSLLAKPVKYNRFEREREPDAKPKS